MDKAIYIQCLKPPENTFIFTREELSQSALSQIVSHLQGSPWHGSSPLQSPRWQPEVI